MSIQALKAELDRLAAIPVRLAFWDPYILGEDDELRSEIMPAGEVARRESDRWRQGRFPCLHVAVADVVFGKQKDARLAARTMTRPFARAFASVSFDVFCKLPDAEVFRATFDQDPRPGKDKQHLSPEGRVRTIMLVCKTLCSADVLKPDVARRLLDQKAGQAGLGRKLRSVFGFGEALLANLRMDLGLLTIKADVHLRRFLAPYLGLSVDAPAADFEESLEEAAAELGRAPFEVDQIVWYTHAQSGDASAAG